MDDREYILPDVIVELQDADLRDLIADGAVRVMAGEQEVLLGLSPDAERHADALDLDHMWAVA